MILCVCELTVESSLHSDLGRKEVVVKISTRPFEFRIDCLLVNDLVSKKREVMINIDGHIWKPWRDVMQQRPALSVARLKPNARIASCLVMLYEDLDLRFEPPLNWRLDIPCGNSPPPASAHEQHMRRFKQVRQLLRSCPSVVASQAFSSSFSVYRRASEPPNLRPYELLNVSVGTRAGSNEIVSSKSFASTTSFAQASVNWLAKPFEPNTRGTP